MTKLTAEQIKDYVEKGGTFCPFCGTRDEVIPGSTALEGAVITQDICCKNCGGKWIDVFTLKTISQIN